MAKPVCVVAGIGPGNGAAFARRFAADGYAVALLARAEETGRELAAALPGARAWACDVGDAASVAQVDEIRGALGDPEVVIHNAGSARSVRSTMSRPLTSRRAGGSTRSAGS
jgi:NAD(P)-dependent dehydrogenase (short-subunit alcohol dehydrogenase family)